MKIIWNEVTWYSKLLALILGVLVFILGFSLGVENQKIKDDLTVVNFEDNISNEDNTENKILMCYFYKQKNNSVFYDRAWLKMDILGDEVSGEYYNLPAEKDSKIGDFEGVAGPLNQASMSRMAEVVWNVSAEGMNNKEELLVEFGDGSAVALFGEMVLKGDDFYGYKDKTKVMPSFSMSQIDCDALDEIILVEKYVRENIKTLSKEKEVLGGSWYVLSVDINYSLDQGEVTYEDGHIQAIANFKYNFDPKNKSIEIFDFQNK